MPSLLEARGGGGGVPMCKCRLMGRPEHQAARRLGRWALLPCLVLLVAFVLWCTPLPGESRGPPPRLSSYRE